MRAFLSSLITNSFTCLPALLLASLAVLAESKSEPITLRYPASSASNAEQVDYFSDLLKLALQASGSPDRYKLEKVDKSYSQRRSVQELSQGKLYDVLWTVTNKERELKLRPIRIPLLKGLIGYRIFLIRAGDQQRFSQIQNKEQLSKLLAGQAAQWPDTAILQHNGLPVIGATFYESLFGMLKAGRFDYFPRGANEISAEAALHPSLKIEEDLALVYPSAMYFYVSPDNEALAKIIEAGLQNIIASGDFDTYFYSHPSIQDLISSLNLKQRRAIILKRVDLPEQTPIDVQKFWFQSLSNTESALSD
ncbi:amino acid ABC transporter substrate-binding protein [Agaribacterium haliotis]|uniref:amino acid ABC transporter substrate-binding protein n=1 Tax=Agaribacterium haliotis TaxID=2013869 RepID=UPI001177EA30|nr:amino acid ABC transporter substrate-binding protein [Agaribacterium haliotis]